MKRCLGVLGGSGEVGGTVVSKLVRLQSENILVGSRHVDKILKHSQVEAIAVDVNSQEQLSYFCSRCHTIINCVGSASSVIDQVAKTCLAKGVHYVDVSGDVALVDKLKSLNQDYANQGLICLYSAGVNPGLTEALASHLIRIYSPDKIEVFFSGNGKLSVNAAIEMLNSFNDSTTVSGAYIQGGKIEKLDYFMKKKVLPNPIGNIIYLPVINDSYYRCIKTTTVEKAYFFNTFRSQNIVMSLAQMKMAYEASDDVTELATTLVKSFDAYNTLFDDDFTSHYIVLYHGETTHVYQYVYTQNWNVLTGLMGAITGLAIYLGKGCKKGLSEIWDGVDVAWVLEVLSQDDDMSINL